MSDLFFATMPKMPKDLVMWESGEILESGVWQEVKALKAAIVNALIGGSDD